MLVLLASHFPCSSWLGTTALGWDLSSLVETEFRSRGVLPCVKYLPDRVEGRLVRGSDQYSQLGQTSIQRDMDPQYATVDQLAKITDIMASLRDAILGLALPIEFHMPDIERYKGIGCPCIHLQLYSAVMRGHRLYETMMIMLVPLSLSVPPSGVDVSRRELEALRQRSDETVTSFISRWREKIAQIIDKPLERDQISMIMRSLQPRYARHLMGFPQTDFGSLVQAFMASRRASIPIRPIGPTYLHSSPQPVYATRHSRGHLCSSISIKHRLCQGQLDSSHILDAIEQSISEIVDRATRIVFSDNDLSPKRSDHVRPLFIDVAYSSRRVSSVLLGNGSALNVCPSVTTIALGFSPSDFGPST
ncbi:hypothetical protein CK203_035677 [Vitis vinifera]|uniref:Retrotransposon gag domain-containing protein n=1 Tax=Vitis vinifera TaxID=29760 RepID=A0A438ICL0_VITVI|nr:hypothetical protein CK203_035677 [Vitis vinifera]